MFIEHLEGESRGSQLERAQMAKFNKSVSVCVERERVGRKEKEEKREEEGGDNKA